MTEAEWLGPIDPKRMLVSVQSRRMASDRKLRLFACACVRESHRRIPAHDTAEIIEIVSTQEKFADGLLPPGALASLSDENWRGGWWITYSDAVQLATCALRIEKDESDDIQPRDLRRLLRDVFGNPFRSVTLSPAWVNPSVVSLAQAGYDDRILPGGHLDPARLAVLSDGLEESGCTDATILAHLRSPGPHVRGCWAVDRILGKQ